MLSPFGVVDIDPRFRKCALSNCSASNLIVGSVCVTCKTFVHACCDIGTRFHAEELASPGASKKTGHNAGLESCWMVEVSLLGTQDREKMRCLNYVSAKSELQDEMT